LGFLSRSTPPRVAYLSRLLALMPSRQGAGGEASRREAGDLVGGEAVVRVAVLARDGHAAVGLAQIGELVRAEAAQQGVHALARAAAAGLDGQGRERPHPLLVEQAVEQTLRRQCRVGELVVLHRRGERASALPVLLLIAKQARLLALAARRAGVRHVRGELL